MLLFQCGVQQEMYLLKDDVMGDIARLLSFESFEAKPLTIKFEHAVLQKQSIIRAKIKTIFSF